MTEEQLQEIEARAKSSRGGILDALIKQQDVPALIAEVRRLQDVIIAAAQRHYPKEMEEFLNREKTPPHTP